MLAARTGACARNVLSREGRGAARVGEEETAKSDDHRLLWPIDRHHDQGTRVLSSASCVSNSSHVLQTYQMNSLCEKVPNFVYVVARDR